MKITITEFAEHVATDCEGLPALIARKALENNDLDDLMEIFREHFDRNPEILNKMLGGRIVFAFHQN